MRYCVCCTVKDKNGKVSYPFVSIYHQHKDSVEFVPFFIFECKDKELLVTTSLEKAEAEIRELKFNSIHETAQTGTIWNYFLLKVDSLNFPFKVEKISDSTEIGDSWFGCKIISCK